MYVQVDAAGGDALPALSRVAGVKRVVESTAARAPWFEVESEAGATSGAIRGWLCRAPGPSAAADAHEPRRHLPVAHDGRRGIAHRSGRPRRGRRRHQCNILAIANKELRAYFTSPIAYIVIGFFAQRTVFLRRDHGISSGRACRPA
jgi:hypothetical protein